MSGFFERTPAVWAARVDGLQNEAFDRAYASVSAARREKIDRLRQPEDQRRSLGAALLLRHALTACGVGTDERCFGTDENGKPFLRNRPDVHFSLSHSGDVALCAVAGVPIGCDVEQIATVDLAIARRFFAAEEIAALEEEQNPAAQNELFFRYWTMKESYIKAIGKGLHCPLSSFTVHLTEPITVQTENGPSYYGREWDTLPGYRCAVCLPTEPADVPLHLVSL